MANKYKIMLYNNGRRVKCFGDYPSLTVVLHKFEEFINTNLILFPKLSNFNGFAMDYELVILGPPEAKNIRLAVDEIGRNITLQSPDNYTLRKIEKYFIEDVFTNKFTREQFFFADFVKRYVVVDNGTKIFYCVNNKLLIEYVDIDEYELFVLKNEEDCIRLNNLIRDFCVSTKLYHNIFLPKIDYSTTQQIFDLLESRYKIERAYMIRQSTR